MKYEESKQNQKTKQDRQTNYKTLLIWENTKIKKKNLFKKFYGLGIVLDINGICQFRMVPLNKQLTVLR